MVRLGWIRLENLAYNRVKSRDGGSHDASHGFIGFIGSYRSANSCLLIQG